MRFRQGLGTVVVLLMLAGTAGAYDVGDRFAVKLGKTEADVAELEITKVIKADTEYEVKVLTGSFAGKSFLVPQDRLAGGKALGKAVVPTSDGSTRPTFREIQPGVQVGEVRLPASAAGAEMDLWVYLPTGKQADGSLPCVFIAPAGSNGITGMKLAEGDRAEHLPYVKAGFAVVAYELSGAMPATAEPTDAEIVEAIRLFRGSDGGRRNAARAVDFAKRRLPEINQGRLYTAGHSSAGSAALCAAELPDIRGAVAYCPVPDLSAWFDRGMLDELDRALPGEREFIKTISPVVRVDSLKGKDVMLFTAADDEVVGANTVRTLADALQRSGVRVEFIEAKKGGHYKAMLAEGVPAGVSWLQRKQTARTTLRGR